MLSFHCFLRTRFFTLVGPYTTYLIRSTQHGYVHSYGIYKNQIFLHFLETIAGGAHFRFTSQKVLQEMNTGKCIHLRKDGVLVLTNNCDGLTTIRWKPDSVHKHLKRFPTESNQCFSPWKNTIEPSEIKIIPGLSLCSSWNEIVLETGRCFDKISTLPYRLSFKNDLETFSDAH